jgi:hypothetical protein
LLDGIASLNQSSVPAVISGRLNGRYGSGLGWSEEFTNVLVTRDELITFLLQLSERVRSGATMSLSITSSQWEARAMEDGMPLYYDFIAR